MAATNTMKNILANAYGNRTVGTGATHAAMYTTVPSGSSPGTEVTGGTYARKALTWSAPSNGVITASATFDIPAGTTVAGAGVHDAITAGNYLDGGGITSQAFASNGTYTLNLTATLT